MGDLHCMVSSKRRPERRNALHKEESKQNDFLNVRNPLRYLARTHIQNVLLKSCCILEVHHSSKIERIQDPGSIRKQGLQGSSSRQI